MFNFVTLLIMNNLELKKFRKKTGLNQKDFAKALDVHYRTIQKWESGETEISLKNEKHIFNTFESVPNSLEEPKSKYNKELLTKNVLISNDTEVDVLQNKNGNTYYMYEDGSIEIEVLNLPFPAYASYLEAYFDESLLIEELTTARFAVDRVGKGNYMSFDTVNDSMNGGMLNDTPSGAKVLAREIGPH